MGTINWTKEQQQIIDMRGCNILVSAAAGSGKTAVLVERIFKRITDKRDPVNVDQFVVVTFTKLAAAQMKDRLRERIEEALAEEEAPLPQPASRVANKTAAAKAEINFFII